MDPAQGIRKLCPAEMEERRACPGPVEGILQVEIHEIHAPYIKAGIHGRDTAQLRCPIDGLDGIALREEIGRIPAGPAAKVEYASARRDKRKEHPIDMTHIGMEGLRIIRLRVG